MVGYPSDSLASCLTLKKTKISVVASKKLDIKCDGGGAEKIDGGVTGQSTTSTPS